MSGLGFRVMELFNYVMLAKQAWNMICRPGSLCAKYLKIFIFVMWNLIKLNVLKGDRGLGKVCARVWRC